MIKQLAAITLLFVGCTKTNPNHPPDAPVDAGSGSGIDAPIDGPSGCQSNATCTGDTPICHLADHTCIACATDNDCTGIGSAHTCLPSGACDGDADISYVTSTGSDQGTCTFEAPCQTVGYALANTSSATIALTGTGSDDGVTIDRDVTILGRGSAEMSRSGTVGPAVSITGAANVSIYDVKIDKAPGTSAGDGINASTTGDVTLNNVTITSNQQYGIEWTGAGNLTLAQSTVTNNSDNDGIEWSGSGSLTLDQSSVTSSSGIGINATAGTVDISRSLIGSNAGGGIDLEGAAFHIVNTIIAGNGTTGTSDVGGIAIGSLDSADTLIFSTIASNHAVTAGVGGIICPATGTNTATFSDNIIAGNDSLAGLQTDGLKCSYTYTDFYPTGFGSGSGNGSGDPGLTADFHLDGSGSAVIDTASSTGAPAIDYFGTTRPQGSGYDMGAAEYMP